jgi:hypothetical protein
MPFAEACRQRELIAPIIVLLGGWSKGVQSCSTDALSAGLIASAATAAAKMYNQMLMLHAETRIHMSC